MLRGTLICKTCGKSYKACRTPNPGVFRWQDVACSKECAMDYIQRVEAARAKKDIEQVNAEIVRDSDAIDDTVVQPELDSCNAVSKYVHSEEAEGHYDGECAEDHTDEDADEDYFDEDFDDDI